MPFKNSSAFHAFGLLAMLLALLAATGAPALAQQPVKDGWITMKIHSTFIPEDALDGSNIDVDTKNGVVTLSGTVTSEAGRARAMAIAKGTDGAKSVVDKLRIAPAERELSDAAHGAGQTAANASRDAARETKAATKTTGRKITDGWIKSKIFADFLNEDSLDDSDIDIDVANGVVTLNGTVKSAAGKARAVAIAKSTDRVHGVKDNLKVG
jgi:hyperosmotically inducible protein